MFFRASTREQALMLGITGYARNLADGRVEVIACGEERGRSIQELQLSRGPAAARVTGVACEPQETTVSKLYCSVALCDPIS